MTRMPMGRVALGAVALAGAVGVLGASAIRTATLDPASGLEVRAAEPAATSLTADARAAEVREGPERIGGEAAPGAVTDGGTEDAARRPVGGRYREAEPVGPAGPGMRTGDGSAVALAVEVDPFHPERRPPDRRYRLPGERVTFEPRREEEDRPDPPPLRVVGSAVFGDGAAALVQIENQAPRLLALGESILGYTLAEVGTETATLTGPAGTLRLAVAEPLRDDDDDRRRRRRGDDDERRLRQQLEQRQQQVRDLLRGLQLRGRGGRGGAFLPQGEMTIEGGVIQFDGPRAVMIPTSPATDARSTVRIRRRPGGGDGGTWTPDPPSGG